MLNTNDNINKTNAAENAYQKFQKYDSLVGTVIGKNSSGCYVRESESGVVVYYYGNGTRGDKVQLSVRKIEPELKRVTCRLDSVLEFAEIAA